MSQKLVINIEHNDHDRIIAYNQCDRSAKNSDIFDYKKKKHEYANAQQNVNR